MFLVRPILMGPTVLMTKPKNYKQFKIVLHRLCSSRSSCNNEGCHCKFDLDTTAQHYPRWVTLFVVLLLLLLPQA